MINLTCTVEYCTFTVVSSYIYICVWCAVYNAHAMTNCLNVSNPQYHEGLTSISLPFEWYHLHWALVLYGNMIERHRYSFISPEIYLRWQWFDQIRNPLMQENPLRLSILLFYQSTQLHLFQIPRIMKYVLIKISNWKNEWISWNQISERP